ncbi:hypothetical protein N7460_008075 [Penicillium canescens]|uniref:Uncharacterized protein n=1 Tax=Penicillium canescens TaxID=5083 RepID=A0AAD6IA80_PENCN|nr:hypothetical protein N7460_008075 [Penicillium canescens]
MANTTFHIRMDVGNSKGTPDFVNQSRAVSVLGYSTHKPFSPGQKGTSPEKKKTDGLQVLDLNTGARRARNHGPRARASGCCIIGHLQFSYALEGNEGVAVCAAGWRSGSSVEVQYLLMAWRKGHKVRENPNIITVNRVSHYAASNVKSPHYPCDVASIKSLYHSFHSRILEVSMAGKSTIEN